MSQTATNATQEAALAYMMTEFQEEDLQAASAPSLRSTGTESTRITGISQDSLRLSLSSHDGSMEQWLTEMGITLDSLPSSSQRQVNDHFMNSQDPSLQPERTTISMLVHPAPMEENASNMDVVPSHDRVNLPLVQGSAFRLQSGGMNSTGWSVRSDMSIDHVADPAEYFDFESLTLDDTTEPKVPASEFAYEDVLCGRGGTSNHHPGNQAFLKQKESMQAQYKAATSDREKTLMSRELLAYVHKRGGRFMKKCDPKDNQRWIEISDKDARLKCSQALRDSNTNAEMAARRAVTDLD